MSVRAKTLLPVALAALLILGYFLWIAAAGASAGLNAMGVLVPLGIGLLLLVLVAALSFESFVAGPLARLATAARGSGAVTEIAASERPADELNELARAFDALKSRLATQHAELDKVASQRQEVEAALRLSEERYALAVRSANDGMWEWDMQNDRMYLSPRWKSMLGFPEDEIADSRDEWRRRIPAEELPIVEAALAAHLDGKTARYEQQHRLIHKSGESRWVLSRGAAIRHASGAPHRMIGLDTDITSAKRIELILSEVAQGTAGDCGDAFFRSLVRHFACALKVPCAFITECANYPTSRLRTLAFWSDDRFLDNFEYDLPGTPCEEVVKGGKTCFHPAQVGIRFPVEAGYEGYVGVPILGSNRQVIGHLAFLDRRPMTDEMLVDTIYQIFTARAAAELERRYLEARVFGLVQALAGAKGEACFQALAKAFAEIMRVREAIVTECIDQPERRLHVLAWWRDGKIEPQVEYQLAGSTCEETINDGRICVYASGVGERFPPARPFNRESYLGVPCFDSSGKVIGHVACFDDKALARGVPDQMFLELFAERAALEIERQRVSHAPQFA